MQSLPQQVKVVVIGAGFAGAATAYHLAACGVRDVLVLEKEATYGFHASGRNAALCRQMTGDEVVTDLAIRGAEFLRNPPNGFSTEPLLRQVGSVILCRDGGQLDILAARAAARDLPHERVAMDWVFKKDPRLAGVPAVGGVYFPTDGVIDIHALLQGFLSGARSAGIQIELKVEVTRFIRTRTRKTILLETARGNVETSCVVNASGAWARELGHRAGSDDTQFTPYQRHLFLTSRVPALDASLPLLWYLGGEDEFYLRPEGTGYLISGCDATETTPGDARVSPGAQTALVNKMTRLTPWLADLGIARSWACMRTFTPDQRPVIGWDRKIPWLFWVAGLGGHGATASSAVGRVAASDIASRLT